MTRSMRVMFLALIAAMLAAVVTLRVKNDALERGPSAPLGVNGS
ncbi:MAG: hypothetical protein Q8L48_22850 [Archangium sp.]|nr:hypothetical protein [Archangium sp.]